MTTAPMPSLLRLDGELTIFRAHECKQALLDAIEPGATVDCDLSGVTEFDTVGVQLLLLAKREAGARGAALRLSGHSPAVLAAFELLDLGRHFGDALVLPA
jgi:anti-anti-sigma factor